MKIIALVKDPPVIKKILTHLGLSPIPPPLAPARFRELFVRALSVQRYRVKCKVQHDFRELFEHFQTISNIFWKYRKFIIFLHRSKSIQRREFEAQSRLKIDLWTNCPGFWDSKHLYHQNFQECSLFRYNPLKYKQNIYYCFATSS